eukprot:scaffold21136_cov69-Skeletonema_dohrnii-CCMP3373.AAC.5
MLDCSMVMSLVCPLAESMAMQKDLQMAHMRPIQQHLAILHIPTFFGVLKQSEMISSHDAP